VFGLFGIFCLGFLLGSIPFALIVSLPQGIDPRKAGSGNPGATNVARLLGKKWGVLTFLGDSTKGILSLFIAYKLLPYLNAPKELVLSVAGVSAVLGHMFSVFLKFKGGKGVATTVGVFLVLVPKAMLVGLLIFVLAVGISGFVSVGSLLMTGALPFLIMFFKYSKTYAIAAGILAVIIWFKHHSNIQRLLKGEEKTWKKKN